MHAYMHIRHPRNPRSKNSGYWPVYEVCDVSGEIPSGVFFGVNVRGGGGVTGNGKLVGQQTW